MYDLYKKVKALIIHKVRSGESNLVLELLLQTGELIPAYVYGGASSRKGKTGRFELGHCIHVELKQNSKGNSSGLKQVINSEVVWYHRQIRHSYKGLCLMSFFLDIIRKMPHAGDDEFKHIDVGANYQIKQTDTSAFRLLSNALFYLDDSLTNNQFKIGQHLAIFLLKLLGETGIYPILENCVYCNAFLEQNDLFCFSYKLIPEKAGFICHECNEERKTNEVTHSQESIKPFIYTVHLLRNLAYADYLKVPIPMMKDVDLLFYYYCYHYQISRKKFPSYQFLFSSEKQNRL